MARIIDSEDISDIRYDKAKEITVEILQAVVSGEIEPGEGYRQLLGALHFFYKRLLSNTLWDMAQFDANAKIEGTEGGDETIFDGVVIKNAKGKLRDIQAVMNTQAMISRAVFDFSYSMEEAEGKSPIKIDGAGIASGNLFIFYPQFKKDYELLKNKKFIEETPDGIRRCRGRSKKFLADYFGDQKPKGAWGWDWIETAFDEKDLRNSYSRNGNAHKRRKSQDYQAWLKIKKNT
ncbi:hypothetical protein FACS1894109_20780 [Spirochaetia bacterium]|nr:hypothetical protein FACS1894109_20780 [Spirochaetia bacterium]